MKAQRKEIVKIKLAQKELGLSNDTILSGYGYESCSELQADEAEEILKFFEIEYGWTPKKSIEKKNKELNRASRKAIKKIKALWLSVARSPTYVSRDKFIKALTGELNIEKLTPAQASKIIIILEKMKKEKELKK